MEFIFKRLAYWFWLTYSISLGKRGQYFYDMVGNMIESGLVEARGTVGGSLPKGLYMLSIQTATGVNTFKIAKD